MKLNNICQNNSYKRKRSERGVAIFIVLSAILTLGILATEFTYTSHLNYSIAYNEAERTKACYLAEIGLKIARLRLQIYKEAKAILNNMQMGQLVSKASIEEVWKAPFVFPPPEIPGMSIGDREAISKFVSESKIQGNFRIIIESESSKFNLNMLINNTSNIPSEEQKEGAKNATDSESGAPQGLTKIRAGLITFINNILNRKREEDEKFSEKYRNLKGEEIVKDILTWIDKDTKQMSSGEDKYDYYRSLFPPQTPKELKFYHISELYYIKNFDNDIYNLLAPLFTVLPTSGLNINTIDSKTLKALIPEMEDEDINKFFVYRDNPTSGALFNTSDDFFNYLSQNVRNITNIDDIKKRLEEQNITLITDENSFKITVDARNGEAQCVISAYMGEASVVETTKETEEDKGKEDQSKDKNKKESDKKKKEDGEENKDDKAGSENGDSKKPKPKDTKAAESDFRILYIKVE